MRLRIPLRTTIFLLFVWTAILPTPAKADTLKTDAALIIIGVALVSAAIGVGVYYVVRKGPTLTGCAALSGSDLELQNEGDQQLYRLIGDTANIKTGDRIRISGKKKKKDAAVARTFMVEKLSKDYGPCRLTAATP